MIISRTDGGGESYESERLLILKRLLKFYSIEHIYLLHDHEGLLTVVWEKEPSGGDVIWVGNIWLNTFQEDQIQHKILKFVNL